MKLGKLFDLWLDVQAYGLVALGAGLVAGVLLNWQAGLLVALLAVLGLYGLSKAIGVLVKKSQQSVVPQRAFPQREVGAAK
nr:hypothetical protein [uncultured Roseateles sp.]